jgi:hypothetical protein
MKPCPIKATFSFAMMNSSTGAMHAMQSAMNAMHGVIDRFDNLCKGPAEEIFLDLFFREIVEISHEASVFVQVTLPGVSQEK